MCWLKTSPINVARGIIKILHYQEKIMSTLNDIDAKVDAQTATIATVSQNQAQLTTDVNTLIGLFQGLGGNDQALINSILGKLDANNTALGAVATAQTDEDQAVQAAENTTTPKA